MKNLKKVLSLVLALAMALSLMTVAFAADAKDYADYGEVNYNEAVDVMTAVGVFDGMNGSFNPDGTLTREQAAKIITYMLMGKSDADKLTTTIAPYSDVSASRWSAGAIAYCTNEGIISGMGHNKFAPTDEVTGLQFAKMLLVALGYDAEIEELVGDSWAINTSKLAIAVGLDNGMEEISLSGDLTREQAAQMAFNAMQAPLVEYGSKGTTIEVNGATVTFGAQQAQYVTTTIAKTQTISNTKLSNSNDYTIEFAEQYCQDLRKLDGDTDAFERPATTWRLKNADIGTYAEEADLTYTSATKIGTIYNDLGLTKGIAAADTTVYEDGVLVNGGAHAAWTGYDIVKGGLSKIGGNGALTEVYYDAENGTVLISVVNTYVGKINTVYAATTTRDAYVTLKASAADNFTGYGDGKTYETTAFAKDDIVYYTYSRKAGEDCIQSMQKAQAVTGAMSTYTTEGSVTVSGTKYDANTASATYITNFVRSVDKGSDVTAYLDAYGYVLYVDADVAVNYAVVLNYTDEAGDWNDVEKAELFFTDGTVKTVEVELNTVAGTGDAFQKDTVDWVANDHNNVISEYDIVSYTVDSDDVYHLTLVADAEYGKGGANVTLVTNGINTINAAVDNQANKVNDAQSTTAVDGKTIFMVADTTGNKVTYSVYEGFANVPTIKHNGGTQPYVAVYAKNGSNTPATVVFIERNARMTISSDNKDVIYVKGVGSHTNAPTYVGRSYTTELGYFYEYTAYVNGQQTTIKTETAYNEDALIYAPEYNNKGILTGSSSEVRVSTNGSSADGVLTNTTGTDSVVNSVIKLGNGYYAYTSDVNVYYMTVDGELITRSVSDIGYDQDDEVFFKVNDKGLVTDIYVKVVDQPTSVTPGSGVLSSAVLWKDASGMHATVETTGVLSTTNATSINVVAEEYMKATNTWVPMFTGSVTIAANASSGAVAIPGAQSGNIYRVTATYQNGSVTSVNFTMS